MNIGDHIFISLATRVAEISKPLTKLDINYFSYIKNYYCGSQIYLSNSGQWIHDYYYKELYKSSLFEYHPESYSSGYVLWPHKSNRPVFSYARKKFNSGPGITLINKEDKFCEFFFFSGAVDNIKLTNFLINNINLLKRFVAYFKNEIIKDKQFSEKHKILISEHFNRLVLDDLDNMFVDSIFDKKNMMKHQFINETKLGQYSFCHKTLGFITLSARETNCALCLLRGDTAKQIARQLFISERTIESHLEQLKTKFGCVTKSELIKALLNTDLIEIAWK